MKRVLSALMLVAMVVGMLAVAAPAFADGPTTNPGAPNASPSGATHGAFNFKNEVYGQVGTPGGVAQSSNSSYFGQAGGTPGYNGAVGQEPGATGYNNSVSAPWGPP